MIINTGQRTDIPAFYAKWFAGRLREGFVCVRNPYDPAQVSRYRLHPSVVDVIGFCTKNPAPMFPYMDLLREYGQFWFVTITPYGRDIEPNVPDKHRLLEDFKKLSDTVGVDATGWRYDPIFLSDKYTAQYHLRAFAQIAAALDGYTKTAVISFIDLYPKVRRNFPEAREVPKEQRLALGKEMIKIARDHGMTLKPCAEGDELAAFGADCGGCMRMDDYERAIGKRLHAPKRKGARAECACYLSCDIGAYNTCKHLCRYCYANAEPAEVLAKSRLHDPGSPFLIGGYTEGDRIRDVPQESWIDGQISLLSNDKREYDEGNQF
ncbi:MAG: DUF1848 domain-containing protein [Clostridia bacterium]|nr:DUF1848 domain-containing protein [Clostridia bacterium]MBR0537980.1 DUF1848 domain-containing protein [Clostridia bacterium]